MESAEGHDAGLIQSIKGATQPEAQKPIPLTEDLRRWGVDATHIAGSAFGELMNGKGGDARDRVAISGNPIRLLEERFGKLKPDQKKAA